jgi:hypothetical protein
MLPIRRTAGKTAASLSNATLAETPSVRVKCSMVYPCFATRLGGVSGGKETQGGVTRQDLSGKATRRIAHVAQSKNLHAVYACP